MARSAIERTSNNFLPTQIQACLWPQSHTFLPTHKRTLIDSTKKCIVYKQLAVASSATASTPIEAYY